MSRSYTKFVTRLEAVALRADVEKRALSYNVTLAELYEGADRAPSVVAARRAVYLWLKKYKKRGNNEIARLFDRSNASISRLTRSGA